MYPNFIKRLLDFIFALLFLPFLLFFYIIIGFIIKVEDKGPIIFKQKRLGKDAQIYNMYKFRTMKVNAPDIRNRDGSTFNGLNDPRVTKVGNFLRKTSIDEIPQAINVLLGNMSFIGPRPDLPDHYNVYTEQEKIKLTVLPGISGYNQAYLRNAIEWKERLKNDVYYAQNVKFSFDLKIFFKTLEIVFNRKGVYISNNGKITDVGA